MTAVGFLNHIDRRVNPYRISEGEAIKRINARGLYYQWQKMNRAEARFLKKLDKIGEQS